jgi:hypothetical protein
MLHTTRREAQLKSCADEKQLSGIVASALTRTVAVAQAVSLPLFTFKGIC